MIKKIVKAFIPDNTPLSNKIKKTLSRLRGIPPERPVQDILARYAKVKNDVTFLQVGANDGFKLDPINPYIIKYGWTGILVEPIPYLFEKLKQNYAKYSNKLFFENAAVSASDGEQNFYRLKPSDDPNIPYWYDQLGSFKKEVVLKHKPRIHNFDELFIEDKVKTISFKTLFKKHGIDKFDLIHIDTEGYDYEVLRLLDLKHINADVVLFEHKHLDEVSYKKAIEILQKLNYKLYRHSGDTIGVTRKTLQAINKVAL
jgi:FkbM family methyltransferase